MAMTKSKFERSRQDRMADQKAAMRKGVSVEAYEDSPADRRADKKLKARTEKGKKR